MLFTTVDLAKRWKTTPRTVARIPEDKLPRMSLSCTGQRRHFRYRIEDIQNFEQNQTIGAEVKNTNESKRLELEETNGNHETKKHEFCTDHKTVEDECDNLEAD